MVSGTEGSKTMTPCIVLKEIWSKSIVVLGLLNGKIIIL